ncbi:hypothetical protein HZA97_10060 [Candidatus Woesearchaeota archaeon]|nr:hypothetical protein [Candidatus Woesearchaeota archaeon]
MWPFKTEKTLKDYVEQIIALAKQAKTEIEKAENGEKYSLEVIDGLLVTIEQFSDEEIEQARKDVSTVSLLEKCKSVKELAKQAKKDIDADYNFEKAKQLTDQILILESQILEAPQIRYIPSKQLGKILKYSPKEALDKGILFRGVNQLIYKKLMNGEPLTARNPDAEPTSESLLKHIMGHGSSNSPFISLTTDVIAAKSFGQVIVIKKDALRGHLMGADEIERKIGGETIAKRFMKKNTEFILAPTKKEKAMIPVEAIMK